MSEELYENLYAKAKETFDDVYAESKAALEDGFDVKDLKTFIGVAEKVVLVLNEMKDLSEYDKKEFLIYFAMKLYYEQKLPWWASLIPKWWIRKKLTYLVDKAVDFLKSKGIMPE